MNILKKLFASTRDPFFPAWEEFATLDQINGATYYHESNGPVLEVDSKPWILEMPFNG